MNLTENQIKLLNSFISWINEIKQSNLEYSEHLFKSGFFNAKQLERDKKTQEKKYNKYMIEANKALANEKISCAETARLNALIYFLEKGESFDRIPADYAFNLFIDVPKFKNIKSNCGIGLILNSLNNLGELTREDIKKILGGTSQWVETFSVIRKAGLVNLRKNKFYSITDLGKQLIEETISKEAS